MNFFFDGCFFGTNNIYIQNNNTFILPERTPFADVTEKMKNFFNIQKNKPFNAFSKNFNDNSNEAKEFQFLKKKSFGEYMNSTKENEEKIESKESINKSSKYLNNLYKKKNSIISNLMEQKEMNWMMMYQEKIMKEKMEKMKMMKMMMMMKKNLIKKQNIK